MKRYMTDGQMFVKIMCGDFYAMRVFVQVDAEGDWVVSTPLRIFRPSTVKKVNDAPHDAQNTLANGEQRKSRVFDEVEIAGPNRVQRGRSRSEIFDEDEISAQLEGSPLMAGKADDGEKAKPKAGRKFSMRASRK